MGFLLGAYGKISAGLRKHRIQAEMMRVQAKVQRASRQVSNMEKQLQQQKKLELNNLTFMQNMAGSMLNTTAAGLTEGMTPELLAKFTGGAGWNSGSTLSDDEKIIYGNYQNLLTQLKTGNEMTASQLKQQIEDKYDSLEQIMLDPLKDEEEELKMEKMQLESQLELASQDYEECKKMEQDGAKEMKPNYTGQG